MKKFSLTFFLLTVIFSIYSQPSKRELIRQIIPVEEIGKTVLEAAANKNSQNPDEAAKIWNIDPFIKLNKEEIIENIITIYDSLFNYEEIEQLGYFFKSSQGRKYQENLPLLILRLIQAGQTWYNSNKNEIKIMQDSAYPGNFRTPDKEFYYTEVEFQRDKPYKYKKSKKSRSLSMSNKFSYEVYYDNKIWNEIDPGILNPMADKAFKMIDKDVYGMILAEYNNLDLNELRYTAVYNLNSGSASYEILRDALRLVNGKEVLSMEFVASFNTIEIKYHNYYYTDSSFVIQFSTFTRSDSYKTDKDKMENLLNGLVIKK